MKKHTPSKAETALLEPFAGLPLDRIFIPTNDEQFAYAGAALKAAGIVGFDTESKPTFVTGDVSEGPHLVQFATADTAFLFQLHRPECRPFLQDLLLAPQLVKVGFDLASDRAQIRHKLGIEMRAVLDLTTVFRQQGYSGDMGVRGAIGIVFGQKFHKSKKTTTSNWALPQLTAKQMLYAANDAYAALRVFQGLNRPPSEFSITGL